MAVNLDGIATRILVDGKSCDYTYMNLDQYMPGHHYFEIGINYRTQETSVWEITVDEIFRTMLNKPVHIELKHIESGDTTEFNGVVTDIETIGTDGDPGTVVLYGGSPTILLDRDPSMGSFTDYTLYNIVADTLKNTGVGIDVLNKPAFQNQIPYAARYKETSYAFLSRLLNDYGEWFYYDGQKLIVGNPRDLATKELTFDIELSKVNSRGGIRNLNVRYYDYDASADNYFEGASSSIFNEASLMMKAAKQVSDPIYPNPAKLPAGRSITGDNDMESAVRFKHSRSYTDMGSFTAKSKNCGIRIGEIATVSLPSTFENTFFKELGSFRVIEVHHRIDMNDRYTCTFRGIASRTETLPDNHIATPVAMPELATVVSNDDPRHQGRVKVRFMWQDGVESTNWIRVQAPDAGMSGSVPQNRGFVFIPEEGDQVMIGFEQGDPGRPFVMGSMFHARNSGGAANDNNIKTLMTRSGHTVEFNDNESDKWGITIIDRNNNRVRLDTAGNNIEIFSMNDIVITAQENISLNARNINVIAKDNINSNSGDTTKVSAGEDVDVTADNIYTRAITDSLHKSETFDVTADKTRIDSTKQNLELASNQEVDVQSAKKVKLF